MQCSKVQTIFYLFFLSFWIIIVIYYIMNHVQHTVTVFFWEVCRYPFVLQVKSMFKGWTKKLNEINSFWRENKTPVHYSESMNKRLKFVLSSILNREIVTSFQIFRSSDAVDIVTNSRKENQIFCSLLQIHCSVAWSSIMLKSLLKKWHCLRMLDCCLSQCIKTSYKPKTTNSTLFIP